ncbi:MAG: hypothetical protein WAX77_10385 [Methylococcaceae bacterium]
MKHLILYSAMSLALLSSNAYASITVNADGTPTAQTLANTTEIYLSGTAALQEIIERSLLIGTTDGICKAGTVRKYQDKPSSGANQIAYLCEFNKGAGLNPIINTLATHPKVWKNNLLLYKRNEGGSLLGILPVANNLPTAFLNVTANLGSCTPTTAGSFVATVACDFSTSNNNNHIPDFGVSDQEPRVFNVANGNAPTGTPTISSNYKTIPGVDALFGIAVTTKLRNALQEAQFGTTSTCVASETESCMPTLSSGQIAAIFAAYPAPTAPATLPVAGAGKFHDWKQFKIGATGDLWTNASSANKATSSKLHICSRNSGAGTKVALGMVFLDNACNPAASKVVSQADYMGTGEIAGSAPVPESAIRPTVHVTSSLGGFDECMDELDLDTENNSGAFDSTQYQGSRWAIGYTVMERNATRSKSYRFIKVDGVAPTLLNVASGQYPFWAETIYLYRISTNPLIGDKQTLINEMINAFGKPAILSLANVSATHSFGISGHLAIPNAVHPATANGALNLSNPINPLSYSIYPSAGTNATNNCRVPLIYSTTTNNLQGIQLNP